jgi:hypothetical protein
MEKFGVGKDMVISVDVAMSNSPDKYDKSSSQMEAEWLISKRWDRKLFRLQEGWRNIEGLKDKKVDVVAEETYRPNKLLPGEHTIQFPTATIPKKTENKFKFLFVCVYGVDYKGEVIITPIYEKA